MMTIGEYPGIEKEFDQRLMPDGKCNIDGFLCVFDVSIVPNRTLEKQVEIFNIISIKIIVIIIMIVIITQNRTLEKQVNNSYTTTTSYLP